MVCLLVFYVCYFDVGIMCDVLCCVLCVMFNLKDGL